MLRFGPVLFVFAVLSIAPFEVAALPQQEFFEIRNSVGRVVSCAAIGNRILPGRFVDGTFLSRRQELRMLAEQLETGTDQTRLARIARRMDRIRANLPAERIACRSARINPEPTATTEPTASSRPTTPGGTGTGQPTSAPTSPNPTAAPSSAPTTAPTTPSTTVPTPTRPGSTPVATATSTTAAPTVTPTRTRTPTPTNTQPPAPLAKLSRSVTVDDIQHLYRRAGMGVPPAEILALAGSSIDVVIDQAMRHTDEADVETEAKIWIDADPNPPHYPDSIVRLDGMQVYFLRLLIKSRNQFEGRLAISLHDRLSASTSVIDNNSQRYLGLGYIDLLRRAAVDMDYAKLVDEIGRNQLMVKWLDLDDNVAAAPNENYARELMELFTIDTKNAAGVDNYTNEDIRQVARAFTGWTLASTGSAWFTVFDNAKFDQGSKTIFAGTPYAGTVMTGSDVVRHILTRHPNAGPAMAGWMCRHYLREDPAPAVVQELATILKRDSFNLRNALVTLLKSAEFYKQQNRYTLAKAPTDRFVHILRVMDSVGMPYNFLATRVGLAGLGCTITMPESVFGCDLLEDVPIGDRLVNSYNLITWLADQSGLFTTASWTYRRFFPVPTPTAAQMVDHMASLFAIQLSAAQRTALLDYVGSPGTELEFAL